MSNELAVWTPPGLPTKDEFDTMRSMSIMCAKSSAVRDCFKGNAENCFVAISVGRELGIPPILALSKGYVIDGGFQLEADVLGDVVRRNMPGLSWEVTELDDEKCTVKGGIAGGREHVVTFTFEMAKSAGWTEGKYGLKNQWKPGARQDTMYAKCIRRLVKRTGGLWASMYSVDADESVVDNSRPEPVKHEASSAAVVVDGERVGEFAPAGSGVDRSTVAKPEPAAATPASPEASPAAPVKVEVPAVDWAHRMLAAVAAHYMIAAGPPTKQPGRTRWANSHKDEIMRVVNLYYEGRGEKQVPSWALVPPMDLENIALWLEDRNSKRAGSEGQAVPVAQEVPPAPEKEPGDGPANQGAAAGAEIPGEQAALGFEAPPPAAPDPPAAPSLTDQTSEMADGPIEGLLRALDELKVRSKGARRYYEVEPKSGEPYLKDGEMLLDLGYSQKVPNKLGGETIAPVSQWLKSLWAKDADRIMLSRKVVEALNAEVAK